MRIGILSDTHNLLRPEVISVLQGCDCIPHAGDISSRETLRVLEAIAPTKAVRGNTDNDESIPLFLDITLGNIRICMTHKKKDLPREIRDYDIAICGHTHQYAESKDEHPLILNPGSCGPRRFHQPVTMAVITTDDPDGYHIEKIEIRHRNTACSNDEKDFREQIITVIRETQKGITTEEIADEFHMDPNLTEQIARLYVTHPGITPDGVMNKMGL